MTGSIRTLSYSVGFIDPSFLFLSLSFLSSLLFFSLLFLSNGGAMQLVVKSSAGTERNHLGL